MVQDTLILSTKDETNKQTIKQQQQKPRKEAHFCRYCGKLWENCLVEKIIPLFSRLDNRFSFDRFSIQITEVTLGGTVGLEIRSSTGAPYSCPPLFQCNRENVKEVLGRSFRLKNKKKIMQLHILYSSWSTRARTCPFSVLIHGCIIHLVLNGILARNKDLFNLKSQFCLNKSKAATINSTNFSDVSV